MSFRAQGEISVAMVSPESGSGDSVRDNRASRELSELDVFLWSFRATRGISAAAARFSTAFQNDSGVAGALALDLD